MRSTYYSTPRRGWSRRNYAIAAAAVRVAGVVLGVIGAGILLVGALLLLAGPQ